MDNVAGRLGRAVRRLVEFSGERRAGPAGSIYGQTVSLRVRTARFLGSFVVTVGSIAFVAWLVFRNETCDGILLATEFAGTGERFLSRSQEIGPCTIGAMRSMIWSDMIFAAFYTVALGLFLTVWWNASWDTEPGFSRIKGPWFAGIAAATLVAESLENLITLIGLHVPTSAGGTPAPVELRYARVIFTLAWVKWLLVAVLIAASAGVLLVWLIRTMAVIYRTVRRSDEADHLPPIVKWEPDDEQPGLGICLSGGGIRSAAFGLGALSALEETEVAAPGPGRPPGVLGQADLLASVSGGGYAASAWRLAVGLGDEAIVDRPIIGDPNCHAPGVAPAAAGQLSSAGADTAGHLFPRLRDMRGYIRNGRGGLLASTVVVFVQMLWHLFLTLALLAILAWPLGRLIGSWVISTPVVVDGRRGLSIDYWRLATPTIGVLLVLLAVLVVRSFTHRGRLRDGLNLASTALLAMAGVFFVGLIVVPWLVVDALPEVPDNNASNSLLAVLIAAGVALSVLRMVQAPIQSRAPYLGGVLLIGGLGWFGLFVASQGKAADPLVSVGWRTWLLAVIGYVVVVMLTNPDLWSLHWLYRRRLSQSFAHRWDAEEGAWRTLPPSDQPPLSAYRDAPGPKQVICAVAARGEMTNTGIPVVSMTFEPDHVTIHCGPDPQRPTESLSHAVATADYEQLFHGRVFANRYRTVFCAAALSAAAVAPSLGRHSLGTTNTLIAALNLRLGVWMPNPMFRRGRRAGPDLLNMFKELSGRYDLADPNVYVTDGGHWENLALVELVRRRTKRIIAVDASGDRGFTFDALHEAIELAQLECATRISFVDEGLDAMRPGEQVKADKNWCRAEIHYPGGRTGRLLYVKAQASDQMPLDILRYSKEDPTFPNYSTADQLLREAEFNNLAILGRESMIAAIEEHDQWLFEDDDATLFDPDLMGLGSSVPMMASDGSSDGPVAATAGNGYGGDHIEVTKTPPRRYGNQPERSR